MMSEGKITSCAAAGCGFKCCDFQQGNYILLYPGELEKAWASGKKTAHLRITDWNYHSGQKAVCTTTHTASCDGGMKPLDCQSYPLFPADGDNDMMIKGSKCPLQTRHLETHIERVRRSWNEICAQNPAVARWLDKVRMVGYEPVRHHVTAPASAALPDVA